MEWRTNIRTALRYVTSTNLLFFYAKVDENNFVQGGDSLLGHKVRKVAHNTYTVKYVLSAHDVLSTHPPF